MSANTAQGDFEGLARSVRRIQELKRQLVSAEREHAKLVTEILDLAGKDPSKWMYRFQSEGGKPVALQMNGELAKLLKALGAAAASRLGVEVDCPELLGCANLGKFAGVCHYICHTVALNP